MHEHKPCKSCAGGEGDNRTSPAPDHRRIVANDRIIIPRPTGGETAKKALNETATLVLFPRSIGIGAGKAYRNGTLQPSSKIESVLGNRSMSFGFPPEHWITDESTVWCHCPATGEIGLCSELLDPNATIEVVPGGIPAGGSSGTTDSTTHGGTDSRPALKCGPDVTDYIVGQIESFLGSIRRTPLAIAFNNFRQFARNFGSLDLKSADGMMPATGSCPLGMHCKSKLTLCKHCVDDGVPGNVAFGFIMQVMRLDPRAQLGIAADIHRGHHGGPLPQASESSILAGNVAARLVIDDIGWPSGEAGRASIRGAICNAIANAAALHPSLLGHLQTYPECKVCMEVFKGR